jgi:hypothetical protein
MNSSFLENFLEAETEKTMTLTEIEHRLQRLEEMVIPAEEDRRLWNAAIARRYNVDVRTISNWRGNPNKHFPAAEIDASGRKFNWLSQLKQYDQLQREAGGN